MSRYVLVLGLSVLFLTGCSREEPTPTVMPEPDPVVEVSVEDPVFNTNIDDDSAFEEALGELSIEDETTFVEIIDDIDADSVQAAEPGEKLAQALASEAEATEIAAAQIAQAAREELQSLDGPTGLEIRPFSQDLYAQVKGVRPAVLYFTAEGCTVCNDWEAGLRADAQAYANLNALVLLVDINEEADLAAEMRVTEPGFAMMLTSMGEMMGPRSSDRLTQEDLSFIFQ